MKPLNDFLSESTILNKEVNLNTGVVLKAELLKSAKKWEDFELDVDGNLLIVSPIRKRLGGQYNDAPLDEGKATKLVRGQGITRLQLEDTVCAKLNVEDGPFTITGGPDSGVFLKGWKGGKKVQISDWDVSVGEFTINIKKAATFQNCRFKAVNGDYYLQVLVDHYFDFPVWNNVTLEGISRLRLTGSDKEFERIMHEIGYDWPDGAFVEHRNHKVRRGETLEVSESDLFSAVHFNGQANELERMSLEGFKFRANCRKSGGKWTVEAHRYGF